MKKIVIFFLLIIGSTQVFSLTEEEEFELYKEFKQSKQETKEVGNSQAEPCR